MEAVPDAALVLSVFEVLLSAVSAFSVLLLVIPLMLMVSSLPATQHTSTGLPATTLAIRRHYTVRYTNRRAFDGAERHALRGAPPLIAKCYGRRCVNAPK